MSYELNQNHVGHFTAAGDYNDAVDQYCIVRSTGTNFTLQTSAGGVALGVLQDRPSSGNAGLIAVFGVSKVRVNTTAHAAIAVFDKLCASTGGGVIASTLAARYVIGRALETQAANSTGIIAMLITHQGTSSTSGQAAA
jgi:hypothetical protein